MIEKTTRVLCYWEQIFLKDTSSKYIYAKGFFDSSVYISTQRTSQCLVRIQPKHITEENSEKKSQKIPVVFGAEVLVKHVISEQYLGVVTKNGQSNLQLFKKESNQCYFVLQPAHTYERDGDQILSQSIFQLKNIQSSLYVSNIGSDLFEDALKDKIDNLVQMRQNEIYKQAVDFQLVKASISKRIMQLRKLGELSRTAEIRKYLVQKLFSHFQQLHEIAINALHGQDYLMEMIGASKDKEFLIQKLNQLKLFTESMLKSRDQILQSKNEQGNYLNINSNFREFIDRFGGTAVIEEKIEDIGTVLQEIQFKQSHRQKEAFVAEMPVFKDDTRITSIHEYAETLENKKNVIVKERNLILTNYPKNISKMYYELLILDLINRLPEIMIKKHFNNSLISRIFQENNHPKCRVGFKSDVKVLSFVDKDHLNLADIEEGDYVYLVHSKNKEIVSLSIQNQKQVVELICAKESNIPTSCIFELKTTGQHNSAYLRHVLTGTYFANSNNTHEMSFMRDNKKSKVVFKPLNVSCQTKVIQPYKLQLNGTPFILYTQQLKNVGLHGYWIKKRSRKNIAEMLSIQGIQLSLILPMLIKYLESNSAQKQKLLIDFQILDYIMMILQTQTEGEILHQSINIFFQICENNEEAKEKGRKLIPIILRKNNRLNFLDIIAELLHNKTLESWSSHQVGKQMMDYLIKEFVELGQFEARFIRIFRLLCGSQVGYNKNQAYIFEHFCSTSNNVIPVKFKFRIVYGQKDNVILTNDENTGHFYSFSAQQKQYIRQYFYLIADCLRDNDRDIDQFVLDFQEEALIDLLIQQSDLAGPILALYSVAYLKPYKDLTMGIHHPSYEGVYNKGKLICFRKDELSQRFIRFMSKLITQNREKYCSKLFKQLLYVFQLSIQNGFWPQINLLFVLSKQIEVVNDAKEGPQYHSCFEEKLNQFNLLQNKLRVTIIKQLIMEIQINLWISELLVSQEDQIMQKVQKYAKQWNFRSSIKLCETKNEDIKSRILTLLHKVYNLNDYIQQRYDAACKELASSEYIRMDLASLNFRKQLTSPNDYYTIIRTCIPQIKMKDLTQDALHTRGIQALSSAFYYFQTNEEIQNIHFRRGLHIFLIQKITQFLELPPKDRKIAKDIIYWVLLTTYALIKDNINGKKLISQSRSAFLPFLQDKGENMLYYIAVDIIEEIYRNNRRLIISGSKQEIKHVCVALEKTMYQQASATLKDCKLISLLRVFIQAGSRTVSTNFDLIIQNLFDKQRLADLMKKSFRLALQSSGYSEFRGSKSARDQQPLQKKMTKFERQYLNDLMSLLIYDLLSGKGRDYLRQLLIDQVFLFQQYLKSDITIGKQDLQKSKEMLRKMNTAQNHEQINIFFAKNDRINKLLLKIGKFNWNLKVRISCCISFDGPDVSKQIPQFLYGALSDLNQLCQVYKKNQERGVRPRELAVYTANLPRFIRILEDAFDKVIESHPYLILKIIQRLFLLKELCTYAIKEQINKLDKYLPAVKDCILSSMVLSPKAEQEKKQAKQKIFDVLLYTVRQYLDKIKVADFDAKTIKQQKQKPLVVSYILSKKLINNPRQHELPHYSPLMSRRPTMIDSYQFAKVEGQLKYDNIELNTDQSDILVKVFISSLKTKVQGSSKQAFIMKKFFIQFIQEKLYSHKKVQAEPKQSRKRPLDLGEIFKQLTKNQKVKEYQRKLVQQLPNIINSISNQGLQQMYELRQKIFSLSIDVLEHGDEQNKMQLIRTFMKPQNYSVLHNIAGMVKEGLETLNFYYNCIQGTVQQYDIALHFSELQNVRQQRRLCSRFIWGIFRFFKLMCEIQEQNEMKIYLYSQDNLGSGSINISINFIDLAINSLENVLNLLHNNTRQIINHFDEGVLHQIKENLYPLPQIMLDFLVTTSKIYSFDNRVMQLQLFVSRSEFFQIINLLIKYRKLPQKKQSSVKEDQDIIKKFCFCFQRKIILLIRSLLQQNQPKITEIIHEKLRKQFYEFLIKDTVRYGKLTDKKQMQAILKNSTYNAAIENISDINIIINTLYGEKIKLELQYQEIILLKITREATRSVEISVEGKSHKVHFYNYALFDKLTNNTKQSFMGRALTCNSRVDKLNQFMESRSIIYSDIQTSQNTGLINEESLSILFDSILIFGYIILTLLIMVYVITPEGLRLHQLDLSFLSSLSLIHLLLTIVYGIFWGKHMKILVKQKIRKIAGKRQQEKLTKNKWVDEVFYKFTLFKQIYYGQPISHHATGMLIISFCAYFFDMRLFSLMLLFLFSRIQALNSILSSFSLVWRQLFVLLLLTAVCTFIFGLLSLNNYIGHLNNEEGMKCDSILQCIDFIFTQDVIKKPTHREAAYYYGKYLSDGIYWAFFEILLGSVFGGLIIHKFAEERDMRYKTSQEYKRKCFICSVDTSTLQKRGQDFAKHIQEHIIWNYYKFMYKVQRRTSIDELTGIQNYVLKQLKEGKIKWIPIDKASDQKVVEPQSMTSQVHLKKFQEMMQNMRSQIREITLFQSRNRNNAGFTQRILMDNSRTNDVETQHEEGDEGQMMQIDEGIIERVDPITFKEDADNIRSSDRPSLYGHRKNNSLVPEDSLIASSYFNMPASNQSNI